MKCKKYEYVLPQDSKRLAIDAVTYAGIDAIYDGPNTMSREIIEEKARSICEKFKAETKSQYASNDMEAFSKIVIGNYVNMYLEKQKIYKSDITAHQKEVETSKKYPDFVVRYRIFIENTVNEMGGDV